MRTLKFLLKKEFRQIFRNRSIVAMILVLPVVQLLILPQAADYEVKNINIAIVDKDHSLTSQRLISKITSSGYFRLAGNAESFRESYSLLESDRADLVLEIPQNFESKLVREDFDKLFIAVNAINGTKASLGGSYLSDIIRDFNSDVRIQLHGIGDNSSQQSVNVAGLNRFNPLMDYDLFMVPGILAILVTMVGGYLTALNIVKEKEAGTIEQINVTPVKKHHFILGKLIPFWILGLVVFTVGFGVSWAVYGVVPVGNIGLLYLFVAIYMPAALGFGLLVSTYCDTQQQAMFVAFFFMMIFILMSGLFTPIDSMPGWARAMADLNPVSYLIDVMRKVVLKGSGLWDIFRHLIIIFLFAVGLNTWAIRNYKKTN